MMILVVRYVVGEIKMQLGGAEDAIIHPVRFVLPGYWFELSGFRSSVMVPWFLVGFSFYGRNSTAF
jgi:hypothetical protein